MYLVLHGQYCYQQVQIFSHTWCVEYIDVIYFHRRSLYYQNMEILSHRNRRVI